MKIRIYKPALLSLAILGMLGALLGLHGSVERPVLPRGPHGTSLKAPPTNTAVNAKVVRSSAPTDSDSDSGASVAVRNEIVTDDGTRYPLRVYKPLFVPNDPSANQWWVGQSRLDQSWDIPAGPTSTVLAIIDTGFALKHEEFAGRWYVSGGESGPAADQAASTLNCSDRSLPLAAECNLIDDDYDGITDNETGTAAYENPSRRNCTDLGRQIDKSCNRIDDDNNGFVDDTTGWDFSNGDNLPQAGELNPDGVATTHGTKVAGIAAARGNNGKGIAGVDWITRILPIQALDDDEFGTTLTVARSIYYAIDQGADIISLSLGSELPDDYAREAVQAALKAGIPVVAAAGNDGCDCMVYPANYPEVIAVGALGEGSQPAGFSSYGKNLDVLAPGTNMVSPTWTSANQVNAYASGLNGTSFATPVVAGMLSRLKSRQPAATPAQLAAALTENVNRLGMPATPVKAATIGFGSLDAFQSAKRMTSAQTDEFQYSFNWISRGGRSNPNDPVEPAGNAMAYTCQSGATPGTPVYDMSKGTTKFFTISAIEKQQAIDQGYTENILLYACLRQPHDTGKVMRSLNTYREFYEIDPKSAGM